jgi:hypothetical protein
MDDKKLYSADRLEGDHASKLFHLSDVLSITQDVKVARIHRPNYPYGDYAHSNGIPAEFRNPVRVETSNGWKPSTTPFSDEGTKELLKFMLGDQWEAPDARKKAKTALLKQHEFLNDIKPPASKNLGDLKTWLAAQEKGHPQWLAVSPLVEQALPADRGIIKDRSQKQFPRVFDEDADTLKDLGPWKLAQAIISLSKLGDKAAHVAASDIREQPVNSGSGYILVIHSDGSIQSDNRFDNLQRHFENVGLGSYIKQEPLPTSAAEDDVASEYVTKIFANDLKPAQLDRLYAYINQRYTDHQLTHRKPKEFDNLRPREISTIKKLPHPELPLAIAALLKDKTKSRLVADDILEDKKDYGFTYTIITGGPEDFEQKKALLESHLANAHLGNSIKVGDGGTIHPELASEAKFPSDGNAIPLITVSVNTSADEHTVDIPKFTAYAKNIVNKQQIQR